MKIHHKIASLLGLEVYRKKNSHQKYSHHLTKVLERYDIDTVIDVGANVGQFSLDLRDCGYEKKIISFEPIKCCYEILKKITKNDQDWICVNAGLGEKIESKEINVYDNSTFSSIYDNNQYSETIFANSLKSHSKELIKIVTLESWLLANSDYINNRMFLKIDTQGYDLNVLIGAKSFLESFVGVSTELSFTPIYAESPSHLTVLDYLERKNFATTGIFTVARDPNSFRLIESDCVTINKRFLLNN